MSMRDSNLLIRHDRKLALTFGEVVLMLMLTASSATIYLSAQLNQKQEDRLSAAVGVILSESISRVSFSGKYHARLFIEEMQSRVPGLAFISVESKDGQILAHSDPTKNDEFMTDPIDAEMRLQSLKTGALVTKELIRNGITVKEVVLPYRGGIGSEVIGVVRTGINFDEVRKDQWATLLSLLIMIAVLTALAIWGILILSHRFGSTVRTLAMQLQGILNHAPMAIGISDRSGRLLESSVKYEELFGRPAVNQTQAQLFAERLSDSSVKHLAEADRNVLESGVSSEQDIDVDIQGRVCAWHVSKFPIAKNDEGKATLICTFIHDITDRKKAEEEKRRLEERMHTLVNTIPDLVWLKDEDGVYLSCNRMFELFCGAKEADIVGKTDYDFVNKELADFFRENDRRAMMAGKSSSNEEWITFASDGHRALLDTIKTPMYDTEGKLIGVLGIGHDITYRILAEEEKRSLEERLQRAEKMEALGTLAGGVAHDLNNVLGVVVGYAELLLSATDESSPNRPGLMNIMKGGERAAAIVQDLLTLARRGVSNRQVLNLNNVIIDCQHSPEFEKLYARQSSVQVRIDLDPDLLNISGSSVHLGKTLFNLVSNASESMAKGGILTIKTANQYLDKPIHGYDNVREGDYVVLTISDTGEGITEADLRRIFEPFYTKKAMGRSGTGLGLAVVWGTVKDHNGYINVQSEEGKGSIFILYFPVTREDIAVETVAISISEYMGSGESILVVDDVKEQRDLAADMLRKLHYNVTIASSGEEAVSYLKGHQVDLMVLDMIMDPGMDGLDTYRSVLEIRRKQKAIIVSGFSESERVSAAQALGAGAYVRKPYVMEKLGLAVRKELNKT
ncbi:MAG: PAS domain-containing protein [Syntrophales bacterium]|nr:PAS domain-containing protein [Syntrophales bacterium]